MLTEYNMPSFEDLAAAIQVVRDLVPQVRVGMTAEVMEQLLALIAQVSVCARSCVCVL